MRVAIGAVAGTLGGPATYALELVRALSEQFPADRYTVLTDRPGLFRAFAETVEVPLRSAWRQPLWDHVGIRRGLGAGAFDLYHGTKGVLPRRLALAGVVTVHDLACYTVPASFRLAQRLHLRLETPSTLARARVVITDSHHSAGDLARLFPRTAAKLEVIPLAAPVDLCPAAPAEVDVWKRGQGLGGPAVGYLGTLQPRKNIDLLAEAFCRAAGSRPWALLLAGRLRPGYRPVCLGWGDTRIRYLGPIAQADVPLFLGALACMVSPSSYEGFGLSLLEAMAAGCPVVGLANSSVPEVVGDAGVLLERADVGELAAAIERLVSDETAAQSFAERGLTRARHFSWKETARRTRGVYEGVVSQELRA